jgi:hypothetical protein
VARIFITGSTYGLGRAAAGRAALGGGTGQPRLRQSLPYSSNLGAAGRGSATRPLGSSHTSWRPSGVMSSIA